MGKWKEVAIIVLGGAVGGLLSVKTSWQDPVSYPLTAAKLASLLFFPAVSGGAASGIGVYVLTTFDSAQLIRGFFFSLACGLAFPSILDNSGGYAKAVTSRVAAESISDDTAKLSKASTISDIHATSLAILEATPKADPAKAKAADIVVQQAVSNIGKAADSSNPEKAVGALSQIGTVAASQNLSGTADQAVTELRTIQSVHAASAAVQRQTSDAIAQIQKSAGTAIFR